MCDWKATKEIILQAESIENCFGQQRLSRPTLVYQHNMGSSYIVKCGASDKVRKVASKIGTEVDAMNKEMDEIH
jgi:hypothetical protein